MALPGRISLTSKQRVELLEWYDANYTMTEGDGCKTRLHPFVFEFPIEDEKHRVPRAIVRVDETMKAGTITGTSATRYTDLRDASFVCDFRMVDEESPAKREEGLYQMATRFSPEYECNTRALEDMRNGTLKKDLCLEFVNQVYILYRATMKLLEVSNGFASIAGITPTWIAKKEKKKRKGAPKRHVDNEVFLIFYGDRNMCAILPDDKTTMEVLGYDIPILLEGSSESQGDVPVTESNVVVEEPEKPEARQELLERFVIFDSNVLKAVIAKSNSVTKKASKIFRRSFGPSSISLSAMEVIVHSKEDNMSLAVKLLLQKGNKIVIHIGDRVRDDDGLSGSPIQYEEGAITGSISYGGSPIAWRIPPEHSFRTSDKYASFSSIVLDDLVAVFYGINRILEEESHASSTQHVEGTLSKTTGDSSPSLSDIQTYQKQISDALTKSQKIRTIFLNDNGKLSMRSESTSRGGYQHTHEYTRRGCWVHMKNGKVYWRRESVCCKGRGPRVQKTTIIKES